MSIGFNVYQNLCKFLHFIKYTVKNSVDDKQYESVMSDKGFYIINADKGQNRLSVIILGFDAIKSSDIIKILNHIEGHSDIYTIKNNKLNSNIVKKIYEIKGKIVYKNIETSCFLIDVRNHILVPKHEVCSEQERDIIKSENYITSLTSVPYIFDTDPQIVWINGKIGDLIKITRKDYHGELITYRVVIPTQ